MEKKQKIMVPLIIISVIMIIIGIFLAIRTDKISKNNIEILDATYKCNGQAEDFYQDEKYIYSFPCHKSDSIFVKFNDGSKILLIKALEEKKVTIKKLEKAGLEMKRREKEGTK